MPLILVIVALTVLRWFEIGPFAQLSWWWIVALFGVALLWFEVFERLLGLDKRKPKDGTADKRRPGGKGKDGY